VFEIKSTPEQDAAALAAIKAELEYYDTHPTEVSELFIDQAHLRRLVQMAEARK
jgi:hypothetical protein